MGHTKLWGSGVSDDGEEDGHGNAEAKGLVLIGSLLPNPVGDESQNEAVTVRNEGMAAVALDGWHLRDAADRTWALSGTIDPGDERTFTRDGQPMALNNGGDTVELVDGAGQVADSVTYSGAQEGQMLDADGLR